MTMKLRSVSKDHGGVGGNLLITEMFKVVKKVNI